MYKSQFSKNLEKITKTYKRIAEGLVMIDGGGLASHIIHNQIRSWRPEAKFHTGIYT